MPSQSLGALKAGSLVGRLPLAAVLGMIGWLALAAPLRAESPKLVVVISVDQYCQEYMNRFRPTLVSPPDQQPGMLAEVLAKGTMFTECHHRHAFTVTAPGHAVQMTGTYPSRTGVIGNDWFDRETGKDRYCVSDPQETIVGFPTGKPMSPRVLETDTVGDRMKLATGGRSKVIGVAIKDRAAILMTGHRADAAYWLQNNHWVTSTYYRNDLPGYLRVLNDQKAIDQFRGKVWDLLLPESAYTKSSPDDMPYENPPANFDTKFPHEFAKLGELNEDKFGDQVLYSPFGNDYTLQAAREIVIGEKLGGDEYPDFLAINFSSNDYVGHAFGPYSMEVEDITYRTDRQILGFTKFLDEQVGAGKWTLMITADHGVAPIPEWAAEQKIPAKRNPLGSLSQLKDKLEARVRSAIGAETSEKPVILDFSENAVLFDHAHEKLGGTQSRELAERAVRDMLLEQDGIAAAFTRSDLLAGGQGKLFEQVSLAFHPRRSGDVLYVLKPYCITGGSGKGTTHGSPYFYDTHVPCLLLGCGIQKQVSDRPVSPACLASTIAQLLGIDPPAGNIEQPLTEALAK